MMIELHKKLLKTSKLFRANRRDITAKNFYFMEKRKMKTTKVQGQRISTVTVRN